MEHRNTLVFGCELLEDPRLPALMEVMEKFHVEAFRILHRTFKLPDLPDCLRDQRVDGVPVFPLNCHDITSEAGLYHSLPLFGAIHIQANRDLCASVEPTPSPENRLSLHKRFRRDVEAVSTIGELQEAIRTAFITINLMNTRLRPIASAPARPWERPQRGKELMDTLGMPLRQGEMRPNILSCPVSTSVEDRRSFATPESNHHWNDLAAHLGIRQSEE